MDLALISSVLTFLPLAHSCAVFTQLCNSRESIRHRFILGSVKSFFFWGQKFLPNQPSYSRSLDSVISTNKGHKLTWRKEMSPIIPVNIWNWYLLWWSWTVLLIRFGYFTKIAAYNICCTELLLYYLFFKWFWWFLYSTQSCFSTIYLL